MRKQEAKASFKT